MIVFLDDSLVEGISDADDHPLFGLLPIVVQQYLEGNHLICATAHTFEEITRHRKRFTSRIASGLARAYERMPVRGGLLKTTRRIVRIVSAGQPCIRQITPTQLEIVIPAEAILRRSSLINQPLFVVENERDGRFFTRFIKSYISRGTANWSRAFGKLHLRCEITPGGGNTTADVYQLKKSDGNRIGIAVVDSDKASPGGGVGDTAKALSRCDSKPSPFFEHVVLKTRTIENLIPGVELCSIALELDSSQHQKAIEVVDALYDSEDWAFHSIKRGLLCFDIHGPTADATYWSSKFSALCVSPCKKKAECKHQILPPLSDKILEVAAGRIGDVAFGTEPSTLEEVRDEICHLLASWFCGEQPMHVI